MGFKKLLKARVIVWFATTVVLVATFSVANFFATKMYGSLLDRVFGGKRAITEERDKSAPGYLTKTQAYDNGNAVTQEICEEGMVLLKNESKALPLKPNAKISVFGKNSTNFERTGKDGKKKTIGLVYGGSGSAAPQDGERKTIYDSLTAAGFSYNEALKSFYENNGEGRSDNPSMADAIGGIPALKTGEISPNDFTTDVTNSIGQYKDAALIVISRIAGEEWDLPRVAADNADRHYLELDNNERALVQYVVNQGFEHVVLLMNGSNYVDLGFLKASTGGEDYTNFGSKIDAAINIGSPGGFGIMALGKILSGEVNPSGHTVDLVYTNYASDPTWQNFGGNLGISDAYKGTPYSYVEYEENIYFGYRYYETRDFVNNDEHAWYNEHVVYPFGFGLSYTTFSEELVDAAALAAPLKADETFDVQVKVKNTGEKAGKDVVQLYVTPPYKDNGIEKVYKQLVGFAKTDVLAPNAEETVTITVDPYNFASFDSKDKNGNKFKGWELDDGDYLFHVAKDSHTDSATFTKNLASPARFENDPVTGTRVEPLFPEVTEYMNVSESLSRTDFAGTMPKMTTEAERSAPDAIISAIRSVDVTNPEKAESMPKTNASVSIDLKELKGAKYDDGLWEQFLDQMTFDEMLKLFNEGCYSTVDIERLGVPRTISSDGPTGLVCFLSNMTSLGEPEVYGTCYYQSECLLAQTYNLKLAEKQAHAIGDEGYVGNERGDGLTYPGWYAPAVNLHRSPFSGRNTEYYSEDPFISGKFAAQVIKGVQEKGMYANVKHFALNDQETHRNGICTWCDEQAIRELYLRPFETAVKEGKTLGLMSSFNRIGTEWTGGSYRLLTKILRNEWGFQGSVICDYHTTDYMDSKQMLYAGGDLNLCSTDAQMLQTTDIYDTPYVSKNNATDVMMLRRSAHNNLYAIVNSSAMDVTILGYHMATWRVILIVVDCVVGASLATWGFFAIFTALRKKPKVEAPAE